MVRSLAVVAVLAVPLPLAACGGGGADVETKSNLRTTTTGQELIDLKRAYDAGVLSEDEYEEEKEKILDRD